MLLGFLIMNNDEFLQIVRAFLKGHNFSTMVEMLKKFFSFMNLTASAGASSVCAIKATEKVLKYLEDSDKQILNSEVSDLGQLLPQHTL